MARVIEGDLQGQGISVAVVVSRFNSFITERLLEGALDSLRRHGVEEKGIAVIKVPGAFEIPLGVRKAAGQKVDAVIALGALIRGGTPHFEFVSSAATDGLTRVALDTGKPVGFGVLTLDESQTIERGLDAVYSEADRAARFGFVEMRMEHDVRAAPRGPANRFRIAPALVTDRDAELERSRLEHLSLRTGRIQIVL